MSSWFIICLLGLLFPKDGIVLAINDEEYSLQQFYSHYPKKQWDIADSTKRDEIYTDFIKRELYVFEAKNKGLENDPNVAIKIRDRSHQLLVNESYEQLVAWPLIDPKDIEEAHMFARKELFVSHILIGYSGVYLSQPPSRSIDDALLLAQSIKKQFIDGEVFSHLAEKYSDDPSVSRNAGVVGWVQWGATVPEFQSAAFKLKKDLLSDPVKTDFGYHLILVTDSRPSDYQYMLADEYENTVINLSIGSVRDKLRSAAISYDSLQLIEYGIYYNDDAITKIFNTYQQKKRNDPIKDGGGINLADFLEPILDGVVICVYDGKGFGSRWFANKVRRSTSSRHPSLDSEDIIISIFKTIILQDIALKKAHLLGVNNSFSYRQRKKSLVSGILYDAYLKHLVTSVPMPDTLAVRQYYNTNMLEKYMEPGSVLIREIRVNTRTLADSLLSIVISGYDFDLLAREYSLINPNNGGLCEPFSRNSNRAFFDAASLLNPGEISPVISAPGNLFSFILLEENISGNPVDLARVYSRIESFLIKENQTAAKDAKISVLFEKYTVNRNLEGFGP